MVNAFCHPVDVLAARVQRLVLSGLCLLLATTGSRLLAGGTVETLDGNTVITVVVPNLPDPADLSAASRAKVAVVRQFERDFPEIFRKRYQAKYKADPETYGRFDWDRVSVRLVPFTGIRVEGVESDLMAIAGGNPPDVLYVNFRKSDTYIRNGFLYPLDKLGDGYFESLSDQEKAERIHPKIWPVIRRKGPNGQEHVWAIPTGGFLGRVLAYRKDLFDEAGISYPTIDWTWDDMRDAARKLTDPNRGRVGVNLTTGGVDMGFSFATFLWSAGGEVMEYNEATDEWRCTFGSREGAEALNFFTELTMAQWETPEGQMTRGYGLVDARLGRFKWERGEVGMHIVYMDEQFLSNLNPDLVGLIPVPMGPGGNRGAELNSRMLGIFSQIKEVAVRDAAWEYIRYQDSETASALRTKILVEGGLGRFLNPKDLQRFGYPEVARLAPKGWAEVFEIAVATGQPEPYGKNSNIAWRMLGRPVNEAAQLELRGALPRDREERLKVLEEIMRRGEAKANDLMIGKVSPEERTTRSWAAGGFLLCVVLAFGFVFYRVFDAFGSGSQGRRLGTRRTVLVATLLFPALGSILLWRYYPLLAGSVMGFQDYRILGDSTWVGLKHFGDMLWDDLWWHSIWNSLRFSFLFLVFGFLPPLMLAVLLQEVPRGKVTYRLIFYLPAVLAGLVTLLLWKQFYDPSPNGALNSLILVFPTLVFPLAGLVAFSLAWVLALRFRFHGLPFAGFVAALVGLVFFLSIGSIAWPALEDHGIAGLFRQLPEPVQWLRDPRYAMIACIIPGIWAGMGPGCLIYLAALKGIPDDFYEAAEIDGAGFLDKMISIVIPTLRPLLIINFVGAFIASWMGSADNILAMTGGAADTEVAPLSIFYKAFVYLEFGPATAMAWMLGFLLIGFTVYQLRILAKVEFRTTGGK